MSDFPMPEGIIWYIEDVLKDYPWENEDEKEGYEFALHCAREAYQMASDEHTCPSCGCEMAEEHANGEWRCADCQEIVIEADERVVPREGDQ